VTADQEIVNGSWTLAPAAGARSVGAGGCAMTKPLVIHVQKVAGISGSEAHLLSLLPRLKERGWDIPEPGGT